MARIAFFAACVFICGCTAEARPADHTERDSAGVRLVEYPDTVVARGAVTLGDPPLYRVGDDPGEHQWEAVAGGALQPDGGAVIADRIPEVVVIGADGSMRSVLARGGQGPAEVGNTSSIQVFGQDTIAIEDDRNAKVLIFENGAFSRAVPVPPSLTVFARSIGHLPPSTLLMAGEVNPMTGSAGGEGGAPPPDDSWLQGRLIRFDLQTRAADTLGSYDWSLPVVPGAALDPFQGGGVAITSGDRFITARMDTPELVWRTLEGTVVQRLRWNPKRSYPTEAMVKEYGDEARIDLRRYNRSMSQEQADRIVDGLLARFHPKMDRPLPLFMLAQGDGAGGLWISDYALSGFGAGVRHWTVIDRTGAILGSVTLPDRFRVLDVANGRVLGVLRDSLDVESVAAFDLKQASPGR